MTACVRKIHWNFRLSYSFLIALDTNSYFFFFVQNMKLKHSAKLFFLCVTREKKVLQVLKKMRVSEWLQKLSYFGWTLPLFNLLSDDIILLQNTSGCTVLHKKKVFFFFFSWMPTLYVTILNVLKSWVGGGTSNMSCQLYRY